MASIDFLPELIPLAVDHKINHKYQKLLEIPILIWHTEYMPKSFAFRTLEPVKIDSAGIGVILWTKITSSKEDTMENIQKISQYLLLAISPQSSFQPKTSNSIKQSAILEDAQVPQEP